MKDEYEFSEVKLSIEREVAQTGKAMTNYELRRVLTLYYRHAHDVEGAYKLLATQQAFRKPGIKKLAIGDSELKEIIFQVDNNETYFPSHSDEILRKIELKRARQELRFLRRRP